jgi:hypothetical protein
VFLNRRRFLKYAGATAGVVGGSVIGLDVILSNTNAPSVETTTSQRATATPTTSTSPTSVASSSITIAPPSSGAGYGNVWESQFGVGDLSGFDLGVDAGVGCNNFPPQISDIDRRIVDDSTDPAHKGRVLELVGNVNRRPGLYVNAISGRYGDFHQDANYYSYGYFRKLPSDFQVLGVNLSLVHNYTEYVCLFYWRLNEYDKLYGWVVVLTSEGWVPVHRLGDDAEWHYFEIEGAYPYQGDRKITRLRIDGSTYSLDFSMPTGRMPWKESFGVKLETTNFWTKCDPTVAVQAISHWSKVGLVRKP